MAEPLCIPPDVEAALLRPLSSTEQNYIDVLIQQTSSLLRTAAPSVDARMAAWATDPTTPSALDPTTVATVVAGVIKRYLINPRGVVSTSDAVGPQSHSEAYALRTDKDRRGALEITPEDLAVLFPNRKRLRAGTIRTRPALAPRPVGRYGPFPGVEQAIEAAVTFDSRIPPLDAEGAVLP